MFAAGGGVIDAPAEPVPTGIGTWRQDGEREFRWTLNRFQIDNSGNLIGETRVFETDIVDPSGETYQGTSVIKGFDLNGVQQFSLMATVHGTRMEIDP